ncbi:DMT family transporter [Salinicola rhizosphaerae]|uniref:Peptide ABC transporter ATP-binding protein n=1 Tax=Salinicola rhizosphaerae TaxID=1443141 RepID=A0ABQ3E6V3_9GAMM|nr:DMT family transporter [Salinicola rhizosphaerae]GHB25160.1 peptide ABC transporter ATP-binding protein [Salinicola rhizosphaerae]
MSHPQSAVEEAPRKPLWLATAPALFLLLWSLGFPIAKIGTQQADPLLFLGLRFILVLALMVPVWLWIRPAMPTRPADWGHQAVVGFLIQTVYFGCCYSAFALGSSAGVVALIVSLQPILVALAAPAMVGETIGLRRWLGFGLGFLGAIIVILGRAGIEGVTPLGLALAVAGLIGMSGATLYEKRYGNQLHPVSANVIQYVTGLITTLPLIALFGHFSLAWSPALGISLAYLVIGNSLIAITLLLAMIRRGEASRVSALFYLVPPCAALFSWWLIDEPMPPIAWLGMAVAAAGVALVSRSRR